MSSPRMSAGRLRTLAATGSATLLLALHFSYAEESDQDDLLALFWPRFRSFVRRFLANPRLPKAQRCPKMSGAWYRAAGNTVGPPVTPAVTADVADVAESRVDVSRCQRAGGQRVRAGRAAARTRRADADVRRQSIARALSSLGVLGECGALPAVRFNRTSGRKATIPAGSQNVFGLRLSETTTISDRVPFPLI